MDAVWVGVIGTVAGGVVGGATSLLSPLILWRTEEKKLKLAYEHKTEDDTREHRRALVADWRAGVAQHRIHLEAYYDSDISGAPWPELAGAVWYETLRPYLDDSLTADLDSGNMPPQHLRSVSRRIADIEREWELI